MKDLFSENTIIYVIVFLIPGFIARRAWAMIVVSQDDSDENSSLLAALTASAFLYAPISPGLFWIVARGKWQEVHPQLFLAGLFAVVFVWPIVAGLAVAAIMMKGWWRRIVGRIGVRSPEPRAWDTFFARRQPCFVRATLEDGTMIGGLYYSAAAASSYPADEDLYLDVQYQLGDNGEFKAPVSNTMGVWIDAENVQYLEFYGIKQEPANVERPSRETRLASAAAEGTQKELQPGTPVADAGSKPNHPASDGNGGGEAEG